MESRRSSGAAVGHGEPSASALEGGADGAGGIVEGGRRVVLFNGTNKDDKRDTTRWVLGASSLWTRVPCCFRVCDAVGTFLILGCVPRGMDVFFSRQFGACALKREQLAAHTAAP